LRRFEAEVEAGKGREVWAAVEELAAGYLREQVAASMGQARADAFVDLLLANAAVSTVVDLALPAGFTTDQESTGRHTTDQHTTDQDITGQEMGDGAQESGPGAVVRLVAGLPAVGVLDRRAGTLTGDDRADRVRPRHLVPPTGYRPRQRVGS
jgi:hypothetical protein